MGVRARRPAGAFVLAIAAAATGCSSDGETARIADRATDFCGPVRSAVTEFLDRASAEQPAPDDPRYGGTVVVGATTELPEGMNGFTSPDYGATQHQQFVNLMTLVRYDDDVAPAPYLARDWEISDGDSVLTFHLRPDVVWHDGTPTTAEDVAFTYRTATDERTPFPNPAVWDGYVRGADGVEVVDEHTVRVRLRPHADYLDAWTNLAIMPAHLLADVPPEELAGHPFGTRCPVGNGPFVFEEHREGDSWTFVANPAFPDALGGRPYLDRYVYRVVPDQNTLLAEVTSGGIHAYLAPTPEQADAITADPDLELLRYPFRTAVFIAWNARQPKLSDARVRRALTAAADRRGMVDGLLQGYGTVATGRIPPFHWAHVERPGDDGAPDLARARALLDDAGWSDRDGDGVRENADGAPFTLRLLVNTGSRQRGGVAQIMQANLAEVGIDAEIQTLEWAAMLSRIDDSGDRDFDAVVMAFVTNFHIDDTDLFHSSRVDGPFAWSGTTSADLDRVMDDLKVATDRDEAVRLWAEFEDVMAEERPFSFLYFPDRMDGIRTELRGVRMDARGEWISIRDWWLAAEDTAGD